MPEYGKCVGDGVCGVFEVRCNAVRALGNLLQIMRSDTLEMAAVRELVSQAVHSLVRNATVGTNMKVRWNACYAMGNLLRNQAMYEAAWQEEVFSALIQLVVDSRNFKVRTSAALALGVPGSRAAYAHHYLATWTSLLQGLAHSDCAQAFSEFQHRDQLLDQLCVGVCHLASLVRVEDLELLRDALAVHADCLQQHLARFSTRAAPERRTVLEQAAAHSVTILQEPALSPEQHGAAALLAAAFLHDT